LGDQINERLKSAMTGAVRPVIPAPVSPETQESADSSTDSDPEKTKIETTVEEIEGFNIIKAIVRCELDVKRIAARDTQSYFGVLLDDNNRKPLARLHFNRHQKYLGTFDAEKNETRHPIDTLDDIFEFAEVLKETAKGYAC